mgnify:CR=1 FL=1
MSDNYPTKSSISSQANTAAKNLDSHVRQKIGVSALADKDSISNLSRGYGTSRKFIYDQKERVAFAVQHAFSDKEKDKEILFHIPVSKAWLQQVVLSLILVCHSSYEGVIEFFRDIFDQHICKGTIFNIVQSVLGRAKEANRAQDLSSIKVGAHDEIFQGRMPVLVGCDVKSTYTYLLKMAEHRDATTWGVHLLELSDQGMKLDHTIADGGKGLRSGQQEAWPDVPCRGDVFHPLYDMGKVVSFLKNRAAATLEAVEVLEAKMEKAKKKMKGTKYSSRLGKAREEATNAALLRDDISTLAAWLKKDILSVSGPDMESRQELLNFIIEELLAREWQLPHRIKPVRRLLEKQGQDLLCFAGDLDEKLAHLAKAYKVDIYWVYQIFELQKINTKENRYWEGAAKLHKKLGGCFHDLQETILNLMKETVRASSIAENLNSRLRTYFFLRKILGSDYLELLQFFLNHRRFIRSAKPERIGKSPKELLTGMPHGHWLELLGYSRFKRKDEASESCSEDKKAA